MTIDASNSPAGSRDTQAYALLCFTALMWGGNSVAGRLAVGEVSPMALTTLRWVIACAVLAALGWRQLAADWPALKPRLGRIALMGGAGYTGFNALYYVAAHFTGGVNISIVQGSIPAFVLLFALVIQGTRIRAAQAIGMAISLVGVAVVASKGAWETLVHLAVNVGDLMMLIACALYGGYTIALRDRPKASDLGFFTIMAVAACLTSLPLLLGEIATGHFQAPTLKGWLVILWIALFPSLLAQLSFMRGVGAIGPGRAGIFVNLVPVFGAALSVAILGEPFGWYHGVALVLVVGGIVWSQRR